MKERKKASTPKVFFTTVTSNDSSEDWATKAMILYHKAGFSSQLANGRLVAIKQHFGEKGTHGYLPPAIARAFATAVKKQGAKPFLTDTNTLYRGERSNAVDHLLLCHAHGFTIENLGCPVISADGLIGVDQVMVPVKGKHYKEVPLASAAVHSHAAIILSHVTGHVACGLGATLKNVGMGLASRAGKLNQHYQSTPLVKPSVCTACGHCARWCPRDAITVKKAAVINEKLCIACGQCHAVCPVGAIGFKWDQATAVLQEKIAEHCLALHQVLNGRICYFNFLVQVTADCDCLGGKETPLKRVFDDIGILASDDPVAVDQASVDLVKEATGKDYFQNLHPDIDYTAGLVHAERIGLGRRQYQLVKVE
jgi:uncharacterized protein